MNKVSNLFLVFFMFCFPFSKTISAQEIDTVKFQKALQMSFEDLLNVKIVTASKTIRLSSDITQKVDIVTAKQINQTIAGNRNIAELIQYLPGASVKVLSRNDANWGAYDGIGPKYSTYMAQGLPMDAFIDPQGLNAIAIERIEIQRGPASVLYPNYLSQDFSGNQSPLAGTVNLIFKEKIAQPLTNIGLGFGSFNTLDGRIYHENKFGNFHVFAGVSYEKSDYTNYGTANSWLNMIKNPEYQKTKLFIGGTIYLDEGKNKLTFFGNQTFHTGDWGRVNREYDFKYTIANMGYWSKLGDDFELALKTGIRIYDRSYQDDNYGTNLDQSLKETSWVKQTLIPIDVSMSYNHIKNSNLTFGMDFQNASYTTSVQPVNEIKVTGNDASAKQVGIYVQEELQLQQFTVRAGGRYNNISYEIEKFGGETPGAKTKSWNVFLWSVGLKCRIEDNFILFANAGSSFMSPGLKSIGGTVPLSEMFVPGKNGQLPNPDLKPEKGIGIDLGFDWIVFDDVYLSIRGFNTEITEAIIDNVISQNPSQTMSVNTDGKTVTRGFEVGVKQNLKNSLDWFANITYTNSEIVDPNNSDQDGAEVPFVPEFMGNFGATFYLPYDIEFSAWMHLGGLIYDSSSKTTRNSFESREIINLMGSKLFNINEDYLLKVFVKCYNITDNKYEMPWQFRDAGFCIDIGAEISL